MELPTLNEPQRLYWLLAVLPVLYLLAQPPRPRRVLWTAHAPQWRLALASLRRRPPRFRALRWLLLSMAAIAVVFAAADPVAPRSEGPVRLVVVVDASASTGRRGTDGAPSPFASAVDRIREKGRTVPPHVEFEVALVRDGAVERLSGPAARALATPGQPSGSLPAPLGDLARAAMRDDTVVWVLTDGQDSVRDVPDEVAITCLASRASNVAVAGVEVEDRWPLGDFVLRARLHAFASAAVRGTVRVDGAVVTPVEQDVEVESSKPLALEFALTRTAKGGEVVLRFSGDGDALAIDDGAGLVLPPLPRTHFVWQEDEDGPGYAQKSARALAEVTGGTVAAGRPSEVAGFLVVEGGSGELPSAGGPMVTFGVAPKGAEPWPSPVVLDWDRTDPLLRGLDLSELEIGVALRSALPDGKPLLVGQLPDGTTAPLAVFVGAGRGGGVHFAFRLQDGNLPLLPAFPQLLLRAYERTQPGDSRIALGSPRCPLAESDLERSEGEVDRDLPAFAVDSRELAAWFLLVAVGLVALRCAVP